MKNGDAKRKLRNEIQATTTLVGILSTHSVEEAFASGMPNVTHYGLFVERVAQTISPPWAGVQDLPFQILVGMLASTS